VNKIIILLLLVLLLFGCKKEIVEDDNLVEVEDNVSKEIIENEVIEEYPPMPPEDLVT
jgi:hypothetical protein